MFLLPPLPALSTLFVRFLHGVYTLCAQSTPSRFCILPATYTVFALSMLSILIAHRDLLHFTLSTTSTLSTQIVSSSSSPVPSAIAILYLPHALRTPFAQ
eukprot:6237209-Pyramimonas_sp.AAC.1